MQEEIDYSSGLHNIIDKELINTSINNVINGNFDYNYVSSKGIKELRKEIVKFTDIDSVSYHDVLITNSSSQSLQIITGLLRENDTILIEENTYFGAEEIFHLKKLNIIRVKVNTIGIDIEDLKLKIEKYNPKMIYVIPTFNNPSGISWDNDIREKFIDAIKDKNIIVIEDDPYSLISYENNQYKKLYELDNNHVIYISSFSKYISPCFSVGYIISNKKTIDKLYLIKKIDLCTNGFIQFVVLDYLKNNNLKELLKEKSKEYKNLLDKSIKYLDDNNFTYKYIPKGGLFMLVTKEDITNRFNICYLLNKKGAK